LTDAPRMFIDASTLHDLDILPTGIARRPTLWSLVDRTRTHIGREALRRRLLNPPHTADEILALQRGHQVLAAERDVYLWILAAAAVDEVERYLKSNWQLPANMPRVVRVRRWYREYREDVERARPQVASLFKSANELRSRLSTADAAILQELGAAIDAVMDAPATRELRDRVAPGASVSTLRFDQLARGDARSHLDQLLNCVGNVEALWSVGVATAEHRWIYPRPSSRVRAVGLVHPLLGPAAVANELHLDAQIRVCFVTGPNMAGKSTFLKAVAVAVWLAHAGAGVPATSMEFVPVGAIFSSVEVVDNLTAGESFYLAEVRRIGTLANTLSAHGSAVAVVDEPFRGTNIHDATEATLAVITRLAAHPAALVFVASHVGEVVPAILGDPRIAFFHFAADITGDQPTFDYRLRDGVSNQRLGMTLLRQEGVLARLEASTLVDIMPVQTSKTDRSHNGT
jgi:DNA mismatch repair protein MutS